MAGAYALVTGRGQGVLVHVDVGTWRLDLARSRVPRAGSMKRFGGPLVARVASSTSVIKRSTSAVFSKADSSPVTAPSLEAGNAKAIAFADMSQPLITTIR
jgi:hypothetical protein